jgi:hypothetical protein
MTLARFLVNGVRTSVEDRDDQKDTLGESICIANDFVSWSSEQHSQDGI